MKKIILSCLAIVFLATSCYNQRSNDTYEETKQAAYYNDWDRAIRADVDMQNMYVSTPRKIKTPIDMYMAMALATKYNYSRRMVSYQQAMLEVGKTPMNRLPEIISKAGYINTDNPSEINPELKATWNILDVSTSYFQTTDKKRQATISYEQSRKVIHNVLQETRQLYWKSLMAQKLLPVMDEMIEFMTLEVDQMNIDAKALAEAGKTPSTEELKKKREYMEEIKKLSALKRDIETAETKLASIMGFHPATEFKLVGKEYGNFELPQMKSDLAGLEWLALTNRPELRSHDVITNQSKLTIQIKEFSEGKKDYNNDPRHYNRVWAEKGKEVGIKVFEDAKKPNITDLNTLRRQRMSALILSQVYVSWARYSSAIEDYQINMEIAGISEDIAEDTTYAKGIRDSKSHLEASRAIEDEAKAYRAYIDLQDSLGNLYSTIGLDALPYYMVGEKPSKMAVYLRSSMNKWKKGEFIPDNRPYLLNIPSKRPPINLSSETIMPDVTLESGQSFEITIPDEIFHKMTFSKNLTTKAGLVDDTPLPKWIRYEEASKTFKGTAMPSNTGSYTIKVYATDSRSNVGYLTFRIIIKDVFVSSINVKGLTVGRTAKVLKRCIGHLCKDDYIESESIGREVETR